LPETTDGEDSRQQVSIPADLPESAESAILNAVRSLRYGSVEVIVHDSRVVRIECKKKIRFQPGWALGRPDRWRGSTRERKTMMPHRKARLWSVVILGALSAWSACGQTAQTTQPKLEQAQEQIKQAPFGLERLQSATDLVFVERGLPANLVPNRDMGIQLSGDLAKNRLNYAIGVFNGTPDGGRVDAACHDAKDIVARLFAAPLQPFPAGHPLRGLGVGLAASRGKQHGALPAFKTAGQSTFFSYAANASASGFRTRLSPQLHYYYGAVGLIAEFVRSEQKRGMGGLGTRSPIGGTERGLAGICPWSGRSSQSGEKGARVGDRCQLVPQQERPAWSRL